MVCVVTTAGLGRILTSDNMMKKRGVLQPYCPVTWLLRGSFSLFDKCWVLPLSPYRHANFFRVMQGKIRDTKTGAVYKKENKAVVGILHQEWSHRVSSLWWCIWLEGTSVEEAEMSILEII